MMNPRGGYTGFRPRGYNPPRRSTFAQHLSKYSSQFCSQIQMEGRECSSSFTLYIFLVSLKEQIVVSARRTCKSNIRLYSQITCAVALIQLTPFSQNCDLSQMKLEGPQHSKSIPGLSKTLTGKPKPDKNGEETPFRENLKPPLAKEGNRKGKMYKAPSPQKAASEEVSS
ncbi:hypothetical protein NC653_019900 [Populus alba x Populus x berolinensis]|uniref:Uncharacterized protein n=1 Tax=Populus alba x Populus x berolinensis TaxID=444605 RepID=A0AAD6QD66_9ROSI|nr:hypothetical protein NC653_019900 [Populus alba x Populus x berolinensis]